MEEEKLTMDDYAAELEASFHKVEEGDVLTGTVIGLSETEVTVDLKYYTEGIIRLADYSEDPSFSIKNDVTVGEEVTAVVLKADDGQGHILLSRKAAADEQAWKKLQEYMDNGTALDVKVGGVVNAGVVAYVEGIRGFIPASKLSLSYVENLEDFLNKELQVRVITVEPEKKKLVLSAKELLREKAAEARKAKISNVQAGFVTEGTVESLKPYGAFVDLGEGLSGLVHVSQISEKRIKSPEAVLKVGDKVKVKVIAVKDGKLSLSMKALSDAAAEEVREEKFDLPKAEELTTSLGDLFKNIKL